jgi:DNA polymerase-3 subunit epsilon
MRSNEDRQRAIRFAQEKLSQKPLYLDTETTGLGPADEIVEIAILDPEGQALLDSLVRPTQRISPDAFAVHGITDEMLTGATTWAELWPQVAAIIQGRQLAIYNADFDLRLMRQSHRRHMLPWRPDIANAFCIMKLYAQFYGDWNASKMDYRWYSLDAAGRQCRISLPNKHRAKDDAALARAVLLHIAGEG